MISRPGYVESAQDCAIAMRNTQHPVSRHDHHVVTELVGRGIDIPAYYMCALEVPLAPVKKQADIAEARILAGAPKAQRLANTAAYIAALSCNEEFSMSLEYSYADPRNYTGSRYYRQGSRKFAAHRTVVALPPLIVAEEELAVGIVRDSCEGTIRAGGEVFDFDPSNATVRYFLGANLEIIASPGCNTLTDNRWPNKTSSLVEALGTENTRDIYDTARAMFDLCVRLGQD
ncbi:MAG: hypothetical protein ACQR33_05005 [Candidatus Saccharibacteria bacterium]